ncbi:MAG: FliM/FliN family flagellar motor switch protein [Fimbriimonadaceae bacterium]|nr:FliM/FliN family flagellar motor switch protein [Fimbriimonadaceae bacterium]
MSDVPMEIQVELDRRVMSLKDVLDLELGSVIRMSRSAGENIDIVISGSLVAFGEIVIIEDTMGVRITDFNLED